MTLGGNGSIISMAMEPKLALFLWGKMRVVFDGQDISERFSVKHQALLAYLAMTGQAHSRAALAKLLWEDAIEEGDDESARNSLRVALSALRKWLADYLVVTRFEVAFDGAAGCWLDVAELERLTYDLDSAETADLQQARALYRGEFLADMVIEAAAEINDWLLFQREFWRQRALAVLGGLADRLFEERNYGEAAMVIEKALEIEPWLEENHRKLMTVYGRLGNFNAALAQYENYRQLVYEALEIEPTAETTALYNRIQAARQTPPRPLPTAGTAFVGRERELAKIAHHLADPTCRILTITGLGGVGKSRLALAAAEQANQEQHLQFLHGTAFVSLVGIGQADLMVAAIADELGLSLVRFSDVKNELKDYLRERELLLTLDNFDDVADGGSFVLEIVSSCPGVKFLITSRERLGLAGERRLLLDGLAYPQDWEAVSTVEEAMAYDGVRLFVQSARQVQPSFSLETADIAPLVRLCYLVSGMPLALKLAAAWLRGLGLVDITAEVERNLDLLESQMRDVPPRQRSMRAVFEQTWSLLSDRERLVFQSMAVFRGGLSLAGAKAVLDLGSKMLGGLVERGLLQEKLAGVEKRYELHELGRLFAAEKLAESVMGPIVSKRHGVFFLRLVAENEKRLYGENPQLALSKMLPDIQNIRRAWGWAINEADYAALERAVEGLTILFDLPGLYVEALRLLGEAVQRLNGITDEEAVQVVICQLTLKAAFFRLRQGNAQEAYILAQKGLALAVEHGHDLYTAEANALLGDISKRLPLEEETEQYYRRAMATFRELGQVRLLASLNNSMGWLLLHNLPEEALACFQEALKGHSRIGNKLGIASSSSAMAIVQFDKGETVGAVDRLKDSLRHFEEGGYLSGASATAHNLGKILYTLGQYGESLSFYHQSMVIKRRLGRLGPAFLTLGGIGVVQIERGNYRLSYQVLGEAIGFFEEANLESELLVLSWELSHLLIRMGRFMEAETNLTRVLRLGRKEGKSNVRALAIGTGLMGLLYQYMGDGERALSYFEEAGGYFQTYKRPIDEARYMLLPMGMALVEQERLDEARRLLERVRPLEAKVGMNPIVLGMAVLEARVEFAAGRRKQALEILNRARGNEERPMDAAVLAYERWRVSGGRADGEGALTLHKSLAAQIPDVLLRERLKHLEEGGGAYVGAGGGGGRPIG